MANRLSPLTDFIAFGYHGTASTDGAGIVLQEINDRHIIQIGFWEESFELLTTQIKNHCKFTKNANNKYAQIQQQCLWLCPEPLKFWLDINQLNLAMRIIQTIPNGQITVLEITDGKCVLDIYGNKIYELFQRLFSVDLSPDAMPIGGFKSLHLHHMGVHLLHLPDLMTMPYFRLYLPRSFAVFITEIIIENGAQFGIELK